MPLSMEGDVEERLLEQDAASCGIMCRMGGLEKALLLLQQRLHDAWAVDRINVICVAQDLSVFFPVADTGVREYGVVRRMPGREPPMLLPDQLREPCVVNDLEGHSDFLEAVFESRQVPLFHYASMIRLPLFICEEYIFQIHFWSERRNAFGQALVGRLQKLTEPLGEALRERFSSLVPSSFFVASGEGEGALQRCPALSGVRQAVTRVAPTRSTVLILGESGVGKESVADAVHALSPRKDGPFVKVNCGAIAETLIDSELFGHERGAFTGAGATRPGYFEAASGGTLFLDEIGELPLSAQVRLLRALDSRSIMRVGSSRAISVDVRLIAATNRDLRRMVREGSFRRDLYYRLAVYPIFVPPLRERKEDVRALFLYFLQKKSQQMGIPFPPACPAGEMERILSYPWPGNVRELEFAVERAVIDARAGEHEGLVRFDFLDEGEEKPRAGGIIDDWPTLDTLKSRYVALVLEKTGGRLSGPKGAAALLGVHYTTLYAYQKKAERP
ncbi:sigma 54-interacting transcriptional regulator [uncultured Mailhella sp.]|uniref:sigma-54 interaction domain-containing protein n=1 Tax=uncultured Mailhella sp. TaxID=1981031 RepID=UPI0025E524F3|nr:sigma 54-interacting transcriptional regulator [uncultured Mailhella sp.]